MVSLTALLIVTIVFVFITVVMYFVSSGVKGHYDRRTELGLLRIQKFKHDPASWAKLAGVRHDFDTSVAKKYDLTPKEYFEPTKAGSSGSPTTLSSLQ